MSFRRDRAPELAWRDWVTTHETELIALGIPREVWADRMTWWRFLENTIHPDVSNARDVRFRLTDLSPEQQQRLYRFLDLVLPDQRAGVVVWWVLNHQFGTDTDNRE
ncbi:MAG: hypothetical protein K8U57_38720 [Planctomycetes bacterium]|nr:hypothetical protein [Planctomycetota bacterium]